MIVIFGVAFSCSSDDAEPTTIPEQPTTNNSNLYFKLENTSLDLSHLVYFVNQNYNNPIPACYSRKVNVGDKIEVCGAANIVTPETFVTAIVFKGTENVKETVLHRSDIVHSSNVQYTSCQNANSTIQLGNPQLWKDEQNNTILTVTN